VAIPLGARRGQVPWPRDAAPDVYRGAVTTTVAALATLAIGGSAQAALAPGTPLKTLAAANGSRYFAVT